MQYTRMMESKINGEEEGPHTLLKTPLAVGTSVRPY